MTVESYSKPAVRDAWADTAATPGDIVDPGNNFVAAGWQLSSTPPARQYFNWILNWLASAVRYFCQNGIPTWDSAETYQIGAVIRGDDGYQRQSLINNNTGNTPSTSPTAWGPVQVVSSPRTDNSANPVNTSMLNQVACSIQVAWNDGASGYYHIATLPVSSGGTLDSLTIKGSLNAGWTAAGTCEVEIVIGNRGGFTYEWRVFGSNPLSCAIDCIQQSDGSVQVFVSGSVGFEYARLLMLNVGGGVTIYPNPAFSTSAPGTLVFTTNNPAVFPPLLNVTTPSTYLTSATAANTYATQTTVAANLTTSLNAANQAEIYAEEAASSYAATAQANAEAYAASKATTAQTNAESYAASVAATAQANSENFAATAANNAEAAAISTSETFARGASSIATNGYQRLPSGVLLQWGSVNCTGGSSGTVFNFPTAWQNCFSIVGNPPHTNPQIVQAEAISDTQGELFIYNGGVVNWFAIGN